MIKKRQLLVFVLFTIILIFLLSLTFTNYDRSLAKSLGLQERGFITNSGEIIFNLDQEPRGIDEDEIVYRANETAFFAYISVVSLISLGIFYVLGKDININIDLSEDKENTKFDSINRFGKVSSIVLLILLNFTIISSGSLFNDLSEFVFFVVLNLLLIGAFLVYKKNKYFLFSIISGLFYSSFSLLGLLFSGGQNEGHIILGFSAFFILSITLILLPILRYRKKSNMQESN